MSNVQTEHAVASRAETGFRIREATADDVETVVALRLALLHEYGGHAVFGRLHPDAEARAPKLCAQQMASPRDLFLIAESDGEPIGLLRCTESRASPLLLPERFAYLSSAYVRPAHRRHGVLRALLGRADDWCAARGLTQMRLHNVPGGPAAAAWAAAGFDVVEEVRTRELGER